MALANQAKLTPTKQEEMLDDGEDDDDDDESMSTDDYNQTRNSSKSRTKSTRGKFHKTISKHNKQKTVEPIQYGPIVVKPRKNIAPTLANGRKSKDEPVCIPSFFCLTFKRMRIFFKASTRRRCKT
jgi:hypothetical protein